MCSVVMVIKLLGMYSVVMMNDLHMHIVAYKCTIYHAHTFSSEHLPPGLPLCLFLSPLAVLLHLIESLTTPIQVGVAKEAITLTSCEQFVSKKTSDQFHQVLMTFKKICK